MAKERLCTKCKYNNNGWCEAKRTNKGLKDLVECEFRKTKSSDKLYDFYKQKKFEYEVTKDEYTRGMIKGLEIAILINKER